MMPDELSSEEIADLEESMKDLKEGRYKTFANVEELFKELDSDE